MITYLSIYNLQNNRSETLLRTNVVAGLKSMRSEDTSYTTVKPRCTKSTILNDNDGTTTTIVVVVVIIIIITFRVSRRRREMYCGHARLCVSVCLSIAACPHYCTGPDVTWGVVGDAPSCALLDGFAIGAWVALLWQHNANAKC